MRNMIIHTEVKATAEIDGSFECIKNSVMSSHIGDNTKFGYVDTQSFRSLVISDKGKKYSVKIYVEIEELN